MKKLKKKLKTKLAQEVLTLASCYKLKLKNNQVLGFTNFENNLTIEGITYEARSGFNSNAYNASVYLAPDNTEITGILDHEKITKEDLMKGVYNNAEITIFLVDYTAPESGVVILEHGNFGEINFTNNQFTAEIHSLSSKLNKNLSEIYSPKCRANLGDTKCCINIQDYSYYGKIDEVVANNKFIDHKIDKEDGYYNFGQLTFLTGKNQGKNFEVSNQYNGNIIIFPSLPEMPEVGDKFKILAGCDKNFRTCISKFNNALNFRGEPDLPGIDAILGIY